MNTTTRVKTMLNQFFDKFIFTSSIKYTHNNFYVVNIPFFIAPIEVLTGMAEVQDTEFQKKIYALVKKSVRERLLPQFSFNFGLEKKKELEIVREFFTASGWGNIQIIDLEMDAKRAIIIIENSPFVNALKGKTALPADTFTRGVLAGMFSKAFEEDIDCVESECAAQNSERCKFIIKPKTEFDFGNIVVQQQLSHE